jgi:hypothetical protein
MTRQDHFRPVAPAAAAASKCGFLRTMTMPSSTGHAGTSSPRKVPVSDEQNNSNMRRTFFRGQFCSLALGQQNRARVCLESGDGLGSTSLGDHIHCLQAHPRKGEVGGGVIRQTRAHHHSTCPTRTLVCIGWRESSSSCKCRGFMETPRVYR